MRASYLLSSSLAAVLVLGAGAQEQNKPTPLNAASLGQIEGILSLCAKVDPDSAKTYKDSGALFVKGQPEKLVTEIRKSNEYKDARDSISKVLESVSREDALKACKAYLEGK